MYLHYFIFIILDEAKPTPNSSGSASVIGDCGGSWGTPRGCDPEQKGTSGSCEYHASWQLTDRGDAMRFTIQTTHTDTWTGVGFSDDDKMVNTVIIYTMS